MLGYNSVQIRLLVYTCYSDIKTNVHISCGSVVLKFAVLQGVPDGSDPGPQRVRRGRGVRGHPRSPAAV